MIPKFRAWHINKQIMCEVIRIDFKQGIVTLDLEPDDDEYYWTETDWNTSHVTLMQSTGLKDIHGVEIYEGDIVKVTDDYGDTNFSDGGIGTICGLAQLYGWYIDGQVQNDLYVIEQCYYIEVIGNIYENQELLEEER